MVTSIEIVHLFSRYANDSTKIVKVCAPFIALFFCARMMHKRVFVKYANNPLFFASI